MTGYGELDNLFIAFTTSSFSSCFLIFLKGYKLYNVVKAEVTIFWFIEDKQHIISTIQSI